MNKYYPFELHCHTNHSDGDMTPKELVTNAKNKGYKGIAITDHNTVSAVNEVASLGDELGITVLKGTEWTTFFGHITAIGGNNNVDWRDITRENINEIIKQAHQNGVLLTIAHPKRPGWPFCTGCYMDLPIKNYEYINAIEVWTQYSPHLQDCNKRALKYYDEILNKGYRIAAVYGYDWHREDKKQRPYAVTYIGGGGDYMESLRKGDTYVSLGLEVDVKINFKSFAFSSELIAGEYTLEINAKYFSKEFCERYSINANKVVLKGSSLQNDIELSLNKLNKIKFKQGYLRIEIHGDINQNQNCILAITSPYYFV